MGDRVTVAQSVLSRGRGLMFRASLERGEGLLIDPCSSIHTMWMRFPIDVLYINAQDVVTRADAAMKPWRIGPLSTGARYVIELPPGVIAASQTCAGDQLRWEPVEVG